MEDIDPVVWSIGYTSALEVLGVNISPPDDAEAGFEGVAPRRSEFE